MKVRYEGEKPLYEKSPAQELTEFEQKLMEQMQVIFWMLKIHPRTNLKKQEQKTHRSLQVKNQSLKKHPQDGRGFVIKKCRW
jgi:hypothetical protein